jgi:polyhydroxyalkanoate synthesis regulator phasin
MKTNNPLDILQQGFRVAVGATATIVETMQDQQKRENTLSQLRTELGQRTQEWAEKGEETEKEARKVIDQLLQKQGWQQPTAKSGGENPTPASTNANVEAEVQDLTEQIITLRKELENLRQEDN